MEHGPTTRRGGPIGEVLVVAAVLAAFGAAALWGIVLGAQFGYDESVYASKSRSFITSVPAPVWDVYRPPGLPILGLAAAPGLGDAGLRLIAAAFGMVALGLAWGLARVMWGALAAIVALLALVASPVVLSQAIRFHNDLPAAALVLALMALLWWQMEMRERPAPILVAAAPLAAAAFYLRYGVLAVLMGVALAAALLWGRRALRDPSLVAVTLLVAAALFLPHVVAAITSTGSPLGIVRAAQSVVDSSTPVDSALQYARLLPRQLAGIPGVIVGVVAVLMVTREVAASIGTRRPTQAARRLVWLLVPATVATIGTVVLSHAEARYLLTPLVLVVIAGAGGVAAATSWVARRLARSSSRLASLVAPGLALTMIAAAIYHGAAWQRAVARSAENQSLVDAGRAIANDAGAPCSVVSTIRPVLGWYSACDPLPFDDPATARDRAASGEPVYVVFAPFDEARLSARRAGGVPASTLGQYRSALELELLGKSGTRDSVVYYRVVP